MKRPDRIPSTYGNLPSPVETRFNKIENFEMASKAANPESKLTDRAGALRLARRLGCEGAHQMEDGSWLPCSTHAKLEETIAKTGGTSSKPSAPKTPMKNGERERGIAGIDTLDGGGLVSLKSLKIGQQIEKYLSTPKEN